MSVDWGKAMRPTVHDLVEATNGNTDYIEDTLPGLLDEKADKENIGKLLWSGNLDSGSITVPGLGDYRLFAVKLAGEASTLVGYSAPTDAYLVAGMLDMSATPTMFAVSARMTRSGNNLTYVSAGSINVAGTSIGTKAITAIYGII